MANSAGIQLEVSYLTDSTVFRALASDIRLDILRLLGHGAMNVTELAKGLGTTPSALVPNVRLLEKAGLITTRTETASRGTQKVCMRTCSSLLVDLPPILSDEDLKWVEWSMPIGNFALVGASSPCGLLSASHPIGQLDDPASFYLPERTAAQLLYMADGYVEYHFPDRVPPGYSVSRLDLSAELCSEYPMHKEDWPSDITVWLNGVELCTWTSPGDFGSRRGLLTPRWWPAEHSQYGLLKRWTVAPGATHLDGEVVSGVGLSQLGLQSGPFISVRFGFRPGAHNRGGINIFGARFGNYAQDIVLQLELQGKKEKPVGFGR